MNHNKDLKINYTNTSKQRRCSPYHDITQQFYFHIFLLYSNLLDNLNEIEKIVLLLHFLPPKNQQNLHLFSNVDFKSKILGETPTGPKMGLQQIRSDNF